jgi:hypothetical protein
MQFSFASAVIVLAIPQALAYSGFSYTCHSVSFVPGTSLVQGLCTRQDGTVNFSEIDAKNCVGNDSGSLNVSSP